MWKKNYKISRMCTFKPTDASVTQYTVSRLEVPVLTGLQHHACLSHRAVRRRNIGFPLPRVPYCLLLLPPGRREKVAGEPMAEKCRDTFWTGYRRVSL
jgi:hypothetical protein